MIKVFEFEGAECLLIMALLIVLKAFAYITLSWFWIIMFPFIPFIPIFLFLGVYLLPFAFIIAVVSIPFTIIGGLIYLLVKMI